MHTAPDIDISLLKNVVEATYNLTVRELHFFPGGEDGYGYRAVTDTDATYFLKIYARELAWDAILQIPAWLHAQGFNAVAAIPTKEDSLSIKINEFTAALYPFIHGDTAMALPPTTDEWREVGRTLARLHRVTPPENIACTREGFDTSWREDFQRIMHALPTAADSENPHQRDLAALMLPIKDRLNQELARFESTARQAQAENAPFVLCHHDPTIANLIFERGSRQLHLIDWDGLLIAPKERDLGHFFAGNRELVQQGYAEVAGDATLNPVIQAFYEVQWNIQEIVDYGTKLLFQEHSLEQNAYDLNEMRACLHNAGLLDE
ncbi:MAG: aminoglycoside phosphotransferase family protein [Aggregatilineales bacterium]